MEDYDQETSNPTQPVDGTQTLGCEARCHDYAEYPLIAI
jgi:hypothetical protein